MATAQTWKKGDVVIVHGNGSKTLARGYVCGAWAIFRRTSELFPGLAPSEVRGWSVTHRATGLRLVIVPTLAVGKEIVGWVAERVPSADVSEGELERAFLPHRGLVPAIKAYAKGEVPREHALAMIAGEC